MIDLQTVKQGDHIFSITDEAKIITTAFDFLKIGLDKNEAVMLISELDKDMIRETISKEWNVEIDSLEANRHIIIKTPKEVLFAEGTFSRNSSSSFWEDWANLSLENGKAGLRIFIDVSSIIKAGLEKQVLKFESSLEKKFDFPCTVVCAYSPENMKKFGSHGVEILKNHHNVIWYDEDDNLASGQVKGKRTCKTCGKEFETNSDELYCSFECTYDFSK
jgi:hypothetical protein